MSRFSFRQRQGRLVCWIALPAMQVTPISTKLLIGDIDGVVREEPLLSRLDAPQDVQAADIFRNCNLGGPFRGLACTRHRHRCDVPALKETVDRAIFPDNSRSADMNVGGILAGITSLPSRMLLSHIEQALNTDKDQRENTDNNTGPPRTQGPIELKDGYNGPGDQHAKQGADHVTNAARQQRTPDHHGRNGVEFHRWCILSIA